MRSRASWGQLPAAARLHSPQPPALRTLDAVLGGQGQQLCLQLYLADYRVQGSRMRVFSIKGWADACMAQARSSATSLQGPRTYERVANL